MKNIVFIAGKLLIVIMLIISVSSCKTNEELAYKRNFIKTNELYKNAVNTNIRFNEVLIRNVKISYSNDNNKIKFSGVIKIQKDSSILLAITAPLGIEIARAKITRDSLFVIDRKNKKYLSDKIEVLEMFFKYPVSFDELQNILINNNFNNFAETLYIDSINKRLYSNTKNCFELSKTEYVRNQYFKIDTISKSININKNFLVSEYYISGPNCNIRFEYNKFFEIGKKYFPENILIRIRTNTSYSKIKIEYSKPVFRERKKLNFIIPNAYEKISSFI